MKVKLICGAVSITIGALTLLGAVTPTPTSFAVAVFSLAIAFLGSKE